MRIGIKEIVYRASFIISIPENFVVSTSNRTHEYFNHYNDYQKIKKELALLKSKDLSKIIITLENTKLKKLIDDYFVSDKEIFAKVLIDKKSPFLRSIVLNKGSKNNIKLGMAVLDEIYLVGKVVEVNYLTSRVLLISDLNAKIPVTLEPDNIQAIMSGTGKQNGVLQYSKEDHVYKKNEDLLVFTSGAGALFKSGIPIGKIRKENILQNNEKIVEFYSDFSQLKYVKVVSYSKETIVVAESKEEIELLDDQIEEIERNKENLKVLLEQKKISEEIRIKIEDENKILKNKLIRLQNEMLIAKELIKKNEIQNKKIEYYELNQLYSNKCKKTFFNNLYMENTAEYKKCILNKGLIKKN